MTSKPNPYIGPRAFRAGEALYGRDREARELVDLLIAERIVLLHSPSGAGKSSLLYAALAPAMRKEGFTVRPMIRVAAELPPEIDAGEGANRHILSCIQSLEEEQTPQRPLTAFAGQTLEQYLGVANEGELLIFDQFEEILTVDPLNRAAKEVFFTQLSAVLRQRTRWALFAMREDYVAPLDQYTGPVPTRLSNRYMLKLLEVKAALQAMQTPAERAGVTFDAGAAGKLADDLRRVQVQLPDGSMEEQLGPYIEPVQLQVVCYRLWEHLPDDAVAIHEADIGGAGDVNSALEDYYTESVTAIVSAGAASERAARDWCERSLITAQGIRGQVLQGRNVTEGLSNQAIAMLVDRHLVRTDKRHGLTWYELAHDRLIEPVRSSNAKWGEANLTPMQKRAALWEEQHRPESLLMLGTELAEAQRWAKTQTALTEVERSFLTASANAQLGVEKQKRQSRLIKVLAVFSCLVASVAGVAFFFAVRSAQDAGVEAQRAKDALAAAQNAAGKEKVAEQDADTQRSQALQALDASRKETTIATAERLAATALATRDTQLDTALLLSAAAYRLADAPETRGALLSTAMYQPRLIASIAYGAPITCVAISPDGKRLVINGRDGSLRCYDYSRRQFHLCAPDVHTSPADSMAFSPDGSHLATVSASSALLVYAQSGGRWSVVKQLNLGIAYRDPLFHVAFAPGAGSDLLAVGTGSGVRLIHWQTGRSEPGFDDQPNIAVRVAFGNDGKWLAVGYSNDLVRVYDLETRKLVRQPYQGRDGGSIRALSFNPKTNLLAWVTDRGAMQIGDPAKTTIASGSDNMSSVAFRPDGTMAVSGQNGVVVSEGWIGGRVLAPPIAQSRGVVLAHPTDRDLLFTIDGNTVNLWDASSAPITGTQVAFVPGDNRRLMTVGPEGLRTWDSRTGSMETDGRGADRNQWTGIAATPDGKTVAAAATNHIVLACGIGGSVCKMFTSQGDAYDVAFAPSGKLAVASLTSISVWNPGSATFDKPFQFEDPSLAMDFYRIAFQPGSGTQLASGGNYLRLWNVATRKQIALLKDTENSYVRGVAFNPDGKLVAYGKDDGSIVVRDAAVNPYPQLARVRAGSAVYALAFSPDGQTLASGDEGGNLQLWDARPLAAGGQLKPLGEAVRHHASDLRSLSFSPDGTKIATAGADGIANVSAATAAGWLALVCGRAGRNLSNTEWQQYVGSAIPYVKVCSNLPVK